jgi:hypothetical protein
MATKDIPSSWPNHLDTAIKNLSDQILPSLKFSLNELLLGLPLNAGHTNAPEDIELPTEEEVTVHVVVVSFGSLYWCQGSSRGFGVLSCCIQSFV